MLVRGSTSTWSRGLGAGDDMGTCNLEILRACRVEGMARTSKNLDDASVIVLAS